MRHRRRRSARNWIGRLRRRWVCGLAALSVVVATLSLPVESSRLTPAAADPAPTASGLIGWGSNGAGALGDGTGTGTRSPEQLDLPGGLSAVTASAGDYHSLVVGSDGNIYASGRLWYTTTASMLPVQHSRLQIPLPGGVHATAVSSGQEHGLAIGTDGLVYAWGDNELNQIGDGTQTYRGTPVTVSLPGGVHATAISAGRGQSLAVGVNGIVYAWGEDGTGSLDHTGLPTRDYTTPASIPLPGDVHASAVAAGGNFSLALGTDGNVYAWGRNSDGQLGDGTTTSHVLPVRVDLPTGVHAVSISAGGPSNDFALAAGSDGKVYAWGINNYSELGDGTTTNRSGPVAVSLPDGAQATAVSAGANHSLALASDGSVYSWGFDVSGALGDGVDGTGRSTPAVVPLPAGVTATQIHAGTDSNLALYSTTSAPPVSTLPVSGSVTDSDGRPVAGALVDVCPVLGGACTRAVSNADGTFSIALAADANTVVQIAGYPLPDSGVLSGSVGGLEVPADGLSGVALHLPRTSRLSDNGVSVTAGQTGVDANGEPVLRWDGQATLQITGCPDGAGLMTLVGQNSDTGEYEYGAYPLTEDPAGSGTYAVTLPPQHPLHGPVDIQRTITCVGGASLAPHSSGALRLDSARSDAGAPDAGAPDSAREVRLGPVRSSMALRADKSPPDVNAEVEKWVFNHFPGGAAASLRTAIATAMAGLHPSCESDRAALKSSIHLYIAAAVAALATGVTPSLTAAVEVFLSGLIDPVAAALLTPAVAALVKTTVATILNKLSDGVIDAAIDAALGECPHRTNALIDPSGTVLDTHGNPIGGATVTILRADTAAGPFAPVDVTQPGIEPAANPEISGDDGLFHWDVRSGYYEVSANKVGCVAADGNGDDANSTALIGPYPVPPPQVGLTITMRCADEPPAPAPVVTALTTTTGPPGGGTDVIVLGRGFTPAATVTVGGKAAVSVTYLGPSALELITPAGDPGAVDVRVRTAGGASATGSADEFFYGATPAITAMSVNHGPVDGGTQVTITGHGFTGASVVGFGGVPGTDLTVASDTSLTVTTPAVASAGGADVEVVTPIGASPLGAPAVFTFEPAPSGGATTTPGGGSTTPGSGDSTPTAGGTSTSASSGRSTTPAGGSTTAGQPTVNLSRSVVSAGDDLTISAAGFEASEQIDVTLHSAPVDLGAQTADGAGDLRFTVSIPASLAAGVHHITLTGRESGRSATVAITVAAAATTLPTGSTVGSATGLANTGVDLRPALTWALAALLLGCGLTLAAGARRRRPRRH